jgi:hypothetical protein
MEGLSVMDANISEDQWQQGEQDGYRWQVRASEYGGEQQRWLVVESAQPHIPQTLQIAHKYK